MRIVSIADLHCGSRLGLTPPEWFSPQSEWRAIQQAIWTRFQEALERVAEPDVLFVLGDLVEGEQASWRGVELITPNAFEQCEMAISILRMFGAHEIFIVRGTPIHAGQAESYEDHIAAQLNARIATVMDVDVAGVCFNLRHRVGRSVLPHGKAAPLARSYLIEALAEIRRGGRAPTVALRGHVHQFAYVGAREWLAMSLPALSAGGGKLAQLLEGDLDWGLVEWHVDQGVYSWRAHVVPAEIGKRAYRVTNGNKKRTQKQPRE